MPGSIRRIPEIERVRGMAVQAMVSTTRFMKSTLFLAAFYLWLWSVFPAMAQMAILQIAKPGDSLILEIRTQPGDAPLSKATYVISEQGTLKLPQLKQEGPGDNTPYFHLSQNVGEGVCTQFVPVAVGGNVKNPGEYARRQGMTLMAAIDRAGGFSKTADPSRVKLVRADKETIYDMRKVNPDGSNNPLLIDGDEVIVPALSEKPAASGLLKPGDSVFLELKKPAEDIHKITSVYSASVQGTIRLPMLQKAIPALGISVSTLTRRVEAAYVEAGIYANPLINVVKEGVDSECRIPVNVVTVGGEVGISGEFPWKKGMTLMEAIKRAKGFTEFAGISRVRLIRSNKETVYDLRDIKPDGSNNPILLDQDTIFVPPG